MSHFYLPAELLRIVGEYAVDSLQTLTRLSRVDAHFKRALEHPLLVSHVQLRFRANLLAGLGAMATGVRSLSFGADATDEDLFELRHTPSVRRLDFADCHFLTGEGFASLPTTVQTLDLSCCRTLNDAGLLGLSHCAALTSLDLSGCMNFSDAGLQVLGQLRSLRYLNLSGCSKLTDQGARVLAFHDLRSLKLTHCHRLSGLAFVANMLHLESLDAAWCTSLVDDGLWGLARLLHLRDLNLRGCYQLTDDGLQALSSLQLWALNLSGCVSLRLTSVRLPFTVRDLQLSHCDLVRPSQVLVGLKDLHTLRMDDCHQLTDPDLRALQSLWSLRTLNLAGCRELTNLEPLRALTELRELYLAHSRRVQNLQPLGQLASLQVLDLQSCDITDDDLRVLAVAATLTDLNLHNCVKITDAGLQCLAPLAQLRRLDLFGCLALTDEGLCAVSAMTQLEMLTLSNCREISHLRALTHLKALRVLKVYECGLTDAALQSVASLPALRTLCLSHCNDVSDAGLMLLAGMPLERLDLEAFDLITDAGVRGLMWTLASLQTVYVDRCRKVANVALPC
jgi:Leucine-rich repeat (LRR) protein